jgi:hypothetical protein
MTGNPKIRKANVLLMIGNVVSALVTIVTPAFSFTHINVKELVIRSIQGLNLM